MKKPTKSRRAAPAWARPRPKSPDSDYARIVPLHYPKPTFAVREHGERDTDPFDGKPHLAPLDAHLTYRRGPLLQSVQVFAIFWGSLWSTAPGAQPLMAAIDQFFTDIVGSTLIDQLAEYSVPGKGIGHGQFIGSKVVTAGAPVGSITDAQIRRQLPRWIKAGTVPKKTPNMLYFVYLDPGVVAIMGGSKSCQNYCGYHDHVGSLYYAIVPYPTCNGCLGGRSVVDALTGTSSHELCEAITDPVPGKGWYDDTNGEIGDICAWNFKQVAGHTVQLEWSNANGKCV